ncbi:MAG: metallophosphoesterase family protein [Terracidiphilus sp.]|nr:metallophosphoesterase family protein [Terracidiphilus sp.]
MRHLILTDIHGNIDALEAVLRDASDRYDDVVCCGDLVGYGASPIEVIEWVRQEATFIVRGNHDRAVWEEGLKETFNATAQAAIDWCLKEIRPDDIEWLRQLPAGPVWPYDFGLAHGSPADEDEYLVFAADVVGLEPHFQCNLLFVGHTHVQGGWIWQRGGVRAAPVPSLRETQRVLDVDPDLLYLINPGSVGQPRDRDPRAAYALWDSGARLLTLRRVAYDVQSAQSRILSAGLPESLAIRLANGR